MGKFKTDNYMDPEAKPIPTDRDKSFHNGDEDEPDTREVWALHIERVDNGFIVSGVDGATVFEEDDNCPQDPDPAAMVRLLWYIIEYFGSTGSRYDAKRVRVSVEPGDKYEGPTPIEN
jgi:hypothetical protein